MAATVTEIVALLRHTPLPAELASEVLRYLQPGSTRRQTASLSSPQWTSQPSANGGCPLLERIPYEVRRVVYQLLLPNCDTISPFQRNQFDELRIGERCDTIIPLLLTNRKFSKEVATMLYGERTFELHITDEGIRFLNLPLVQSLHEVAGFTSNKTKIDSAQTAFGFHRFRSLHIKIFGTLGGAYMFKRSFSYRHMLKHLVELMGKSPSNMVKIVVELSGDPQVWSSSKTNTPQPSRVHPLSLIEFICQPLGYLRNVNRAAIILPDELKDHSGLQEWVSQITTKMESTGPSDFDECDRISEKHFGCLEEEQLDLQIRSRWSFGLYRNNEEKIAENAAIGFKDEADKVEEGEVEEAEIEVDEVEGHKSEEDKVEEDRVEDNIDEDEDHVDCTEELVFRGRATRSTTRAMQTINSLPVRPKPSGGENSNPSENPTRRRLEDFVRNERALAQSARDVHEHRTEGIGHTSADATQSLTHSHYRTPSDGSESRKRKLPFRTTSSRLSDISDNNNDKRNEPSTQDDEDAKPNEQRRKRRSFGQNTSPNDASQSDAIVNPTLDDDAETNGQIKRRSFGKDTSPSSKDPGHGAGAAALPIRSRVKRNGRIGWW